MAGITPFHAKLVFLSRDKNFHKRLAPAIIFVVDSIRMLMAFLDGVF